MQISEPVFSAAQRGDPLALNELLASLHPDIRRYARRQCQRSSAVEDVVQEAMIILYRRVGTVKSAAALGAWLVKTVSRLCMLPVLMLLRGVEELSTLENAARFARMPVDDLRIDLVRALESLSAQHREVILLRDMQEMTLREMADQLQLSPEATKSRLHRARLLVREYLAPKGAA